MATKLICDGCGHEILKVSEGKRTKIGEDGDGLPRSASLELNSAMVQWDLCFACLKRAAHALAEALPHSPRKEWDHVLGLSPRPGE